MLVVLETIEHAMVCSCGAVTITVGGKNYSMSEDTWKADGQQDPQLLDAQQVWGCDHCVNRWGIDICACGSGERPDECAEGFEDCGQATYQIGEPLPTHGWR